MDVVGRGVARVHEQPPRQPSDERRVGNDERPGLGTSMGEDQHVPGHPLDAPRREVVASQELLSRRCCKEADEAAVDGVPVDPLPLG